MKTQYTVLYDAQCDICQSGVSWLRVLDREQVVRCIPIESANLAALDPRLKLEECLRDIHVVTEHG